jgi:hypothetical protein
MCEANVNVYVDRAHAQTAVLAGEAVASPASCSWVRPGSMSFPLGRRFACITLTLRCVPHLSDIGRYRTRPGHTVFFLDLAATIVARHEFRGLFWSSGGRGRGTHSFSISGGTGDLVCSTTLGNQPDGSLTRDLEKFRRHRLLHGRGLGELKSTISKRLVQCQIGTPLLSPSLSPITFAIS